ncbi:MAG TPA: TolC family protein [Candidatus Sulfopaludibacter sp.]|nr:TolC family protein [Candidatus Sulfopaludibacter sp.]
MPIRSLSAFLVLVLAAGASAQVSSFPTPAYFRETFAQPVPRVELKDPLRLKDFVVNGSLELSLRSYLELVMANNTDIQIQLLAMETPRNAIERALGTWDPVATAQFSTTRSTSPSVTALSGANTVETLNQPLTVNVTQTLPTGAQYTVGFSADKNTTNSAFATLNPALSSALAFNFSQPLLRNRGYYVNHLSLTMARSRYRIAGLSLRNQLLQLLNAAENAYWDVIQARESLRVAESALKLAEDSLALSEKEFQLGALAQLDLYNPQQQRASADLAVSQSRFALAQTENALRKQMGADLDPDIRTLPIVLTETVDTPVQMSILDPEEAVQKAMALRPDLKAAVQSLDVDDMAIQQTRNALLPNLSFNASYQTQGIGGIFYPRSVDVLTGAPIIVQPVPGGFGDALSQMFGLGFPVYTFGLNLQLPIRSHSAAADLADAVVQKRRDALTVRNTQQQVRLSMLNALSNLESSRKSVELAQVAADFARKYLDAENQKYQLGIDPMQFVLQAQNALTQADSSVVQSQVGLRRNMLNLLTQTGELLDERGIIVP